jgi:hypothetical protein
MSAHKLARPPARPHGATYGVPFRQRRRPAPMLTITDPERAATSIVTRIWRIARERGCGCYLFVDDHCQAYVVSEESTAAHLWALEHPQWWLGCWTRTATVEDVLAEIRDAIR